MEINKIKDKYKQNKNDTGSMEVQIVEITKKINGLVEHFKNNKFDHSSKRGLQRLVNRRRKFLDNIKNENFELYKNLIQDLELRK